MKQIYHFKIFSHLLVTMAAAFCAPLGQAQNLLPNLTLPKLVGFYDLNLSDRCISENVNTAEERPNTSAMLTTIGGSRLNLAVRTHGKSETLNLFSSQPHLVQPPAQMAIGDGESNWTVINTHAIERPTMVTLSAIVEGDWRNDFTDQDQLLLLPPIALDSADIYPNKTLYTHGERLTIEGQLTYAFPFNQGIDVYLSNPRARLADGSFINMDGEPWEIARLLGSSAIHTDVQQRERDFAFEFEAQWPNDLRVAGYYSLTFNSQLFIIEPDFCDVFGRRVLDVSFTVKNPKAVLPPKKVLSLK